MTEKQIIIIGAGVTGCAIARELSRRKLDICVLDKESDVCEGTSKANSGIVHAGYDAKPGTLKAALNVEGNKRMKALSQELDFPFKQNGSLVLCFDEKSLPNLEELYKRGIENGVEGLELLDASQIQAIEPNISDEVVAALYAPTAGIVCPFNLTIALAENAVDNGVSFLLDTEVTEIKKSDASGYEVSVIRKPSPVNGLETEEEAEYHADIVINAAGVYADRFHNMVSADKIHITPRKGEYCLLDKKVGGYVSSTLFQLPTAKGKGVLVTPTVHGNLLVGPTAVDVDDYDMKDTTAEGLDRCLEVGGRSVRNLPSRGNIITSFAGLRAHEDSGDFIIGQPSDAPGFIDVAGIESPGLSCAPAIGRYVAELVEKLYPSEEKENFRARRKGIVSVALADDETKQKLIAKDHRYANVVCRCEVVTEGEIVAAINRPLGATTLDGIKRRTRAGMGRCQAGFCTPRQMAILARELGIDEEMITKRGGKSVLLEGYPKQEMEGGEAHE